MIFQDLRSIIFQDIKSIRLFQNIKLTNSTRKTHAILPKERVSKQIMHNFPLFVDFI